MGGGCDVFLACLLAQMLRGRRPAKLVYATTKREPPDGEQISPHVWRVPAARVDGPESRTLEDRVLRGDRGCPLIMVLPRWLPATELADEIAALGFDRIVGVDTGGDSIVPTALSGPQGRDQQMLRVLEATQRPVLHVVAAPGSDGEATWPDLLQTLGHLAASGRYLGCLALPALVPQLKSLAAGLSPDRTPNIIAAAVENRLSRLGPRGWQEVPRGLHPQVPREALVHAFVFRWT